MSLTANEDDVRPVEYKVLHITKYMPEKYQSRLDGKVYGPYFRCQIDRIAEDVAKQFLNGGAAGPLAEESKLTPTDVQRLFDTVFIPTLAGRLDPRMYMRNFYGMLDHRFGFEGNLSSVRHQTQRLNELYAPAVSLVSKVVQSALRELEELT